MSGKKAPERKNIGNTMTCMTRPNVSVVFMTSGDAAGYLASSKKEIARIREQEATKAEDMLGVKKLYFLRIYQGCLSSKQIVKEDKRKNPRGKMRC